MFLDKALHRNEVLHALHIFGCKHVIFVRKLVCDCNLLYALRLLARTTGLLFQKNLSLQIQNLH